MVSSIGYSRPVHLPNILRARHSAGKVMMPVQKGLSLYARFKHVQGVAAKEGEQGNPISKLQTLNNLIERLSKMKLQKIETKDTSGMSAEAVDAMIDNYKQELHRVAAQQTTASTFGGGDAMGVLVDMSA